MTTLQKDILKVLFAGGSIIQYGQYRLRDNKFNPVRKFNSKTFWSIKYLLRKDKKYGFIVLDKNKVRQQNGNSWVKKYYKGVTK